MAKQKKRNKPMVRKEKSKPAKLNWSEILLNALIDLLVGVLLTLIGNMMK